MKNSALSQTELNEAALRLEESIRRDSEKKKPDLEYMRKHPLSLEQKKIQAAAIQRQMRSWEERSGWTRP